MAKKKKSKFPQERLFVRHIYAVSEEGQKKLLYADEIAYTVRNKKDADTLHVTMHHDVTDLLDRKIKVEVFDKSASAQKN